MEEQKVCEMLTLFQKRYPNPRPALRYNNAFELLVAVILSAQCTDERVNRVTESLFLECGTPEKMLALGEDALAKRIFSCGLYRSKARHLIQTCQALLDDYGGQVPATLEQLKTLPGVGVKTANVVYSVQFGGDAIAVDTHVFRVSNRLGLSQSKTPTACEKDLQRVIPKKMWGKAHHYLIFLGREICSAKKPNCENCFLNHLCEKRIRKK